MEASTQPQPAVPSPSATIQPTAVTPIGTNPVTPSTPSESKTPLIISVVLVVVVLVILIILLILTQNKPTVTDNPNFQDTPVSAPTSQTTTTPETSASTGNTANPTPVVSDTANNTFEARIFYLGFNYTTALTSDTTSRITNADGTSKCFQENASGIDISLTINQGTPECMGATGGGTLERTSEISKDGKSMDILIDQDSSTNRFTARISYSAPSPLAMSAFITLEADTQAQVKTNAVALVKSLSFDTTKMKSELTDKIIK